MVCTIDLAASVAALTGQTLENGTCRDSMDLHAALLGKAGAAGRDHLVQQDNGNSGTFGLRVGDWKLHRYDRRRARNVVVEQELANTPRPRYLLFNLSDDPAEQQNVIAEHPDVAEQLKTRLEQIIAAGHTR
jgi:arylsulfatase A-like enzyme